MCGPCFTWRRGRRGAPPAGLRRRHWRHQWGAKKAFVGSRRRGVAGVVRTKTTPFIRSVDWFVWSLRGHGSRPTLAYRVRAATNAALSWALKKAGSVDPAAFMQAFTTQPEELLSHPIRWSFIPNCLLIHVYQFKFPPLIRHPFLRSWYFGERNSSHQV